MTGHHQTQQAEDYDEEDLNKRQPKKKTNK